MSPIMLSSQPIVLPNPAIGSALFYLRPRHSCRSAVRCIRGQRRVFEVLPRKEEDVFCRSDRNFQVRPTVNDVSDSNFLLDTPPRRHKLPVRKFSRLRVAYQGMPGSYSEAAALEAYPYCQTIPFNEYKAALQAVEMGRADCAVLSLESYIGGHIDENYDLLFPHRLYIVGELYLPIHLCLLALPGVKKRNLNQVISHPRAIAQCKETLQGLRLNVLELMDDTAAAAAHVANNGLRDTAAIASVRAAQLYGLQVLCEGIQDSSDNMTRFVMLAPEPIIPRTNRLLMTSIVFADNRESDLESVFSALDDLDISHLRIVRRPENRRPSYLVHNPFSSLNSKDILVLPCPG